MEYKHYLKCDRPHPKLSTRITTMTLQELQEQALKLSIEERWQLIWVVLRLRQRSVSPR